MPPHSSHLLQPLDVSCFSVLKQSYRRLVTEQARLGVSQIDKAEFLFLLQPARNQAYSTSNIQSGFMAAGLAPLEPQQVLQRLQIHMRTPSPPLQGPHQIATPWQLETPHNLTQLEQQVKAIKGYLKRRSQSPPSPTNLALNQLIKGAQLAMHGAVLLTRENEQLRAVNERQKRRTNAKRSQLAKGGSLTGAQAQELIQGLEIVPNAEGGPSSAQGRSAILPNCMKCFSSDHKTRECTGS
jgi:hypothetical protein